VRKLAQRAGVSVRQLERLFADHLGSTIQARYLRMRLDRARILLRQTTLPVVEVAAETGFVTPSHFSRTYRSVFGRSPRQDRQGMDAPPRGRRTLAQAVRLLIRINSRVEFDAGII
jgi:transcriptional regulator GlxA family with amidase domain